MPSLFNIGHKSSACPLFSQILHSSSHAIFQFGIGSNIKMGLALKKPDGVPGKSWPAVSQFLRSLFSFAIGTDPNPDPYWNVCCLWRSTVWIRYRNDQRYSCHGVCHELPGASPVIYRSPNTIVVTGRISSQLVSAMKRVI